MEPIWEAHLDADQLLTDAGVDIRQVEGDRAYYRLSADEIVLPKWKQCSSDNHYYQTALHELGHATGHSERMNRRSLIEGLKAGFGSEAYAREELRTEISAMMTGEKIGIGHNPSRDAAYVESWIEVVEKDSRKIRRAAADLQKISDYVLVRSRQRPGRRERQAAKSVPSRTPPNAATLLPRARPRKSWQVHGADFSRVRLPHCGIPKANPSFSI